MARKTTTETGTPRKKKAVATSQPAVVEAVKAQAAVEVPKKAAAAAQATAMKTIVNLDEEIRRRAYELFLQRNGAAGDPNHDWLIAEREVRSRYTGKERTFVRAATQGR